MTDATSGATAPPKKRFGFKKAAWQTAPTEGQQEQDIFSHSSEFQSIVAEESKRRLEEKKLLQEVRRQKLQEERNPKRRRVPATLNEDPFGTGLGSPTAKEKDTRSKSKTPTSPIGNTLRRDTTSNPHHALTKPANSLSAFSRTSEVIDLGDTDDEDQLLHKASHSQINPIPIHYKCASSEEPEEVDDPAIAALKAKARAKAAAEAGKGEPVQTIASTQKPDTAIVQLFITSEIPNTNPLIVKVRTDTTLEKPKAAWCTKQGLSPQLVFMTWNRRRIYDSTMIQRLGVQVDEHGLVRLEGDPNIYDESYQPKIHVEAWTEEDFQRRKKEDALEAAAKKQASQHLPTIQEPGPTSEAAPPTDPQTIRLFLKAKGKDEFKIKVKPTTDFGHLASAYKKTMGVSENQPITLMFDGERLKPFDTVADADMADMDAIEVHFR